MSKKKKTGIAFLILCLVGLFAFVYYKPSSSKSSSNRYHLISYTPRQILQESALIKSNKGQLLATKWKVEVPKEWDVEERSEYKGRFSPNTISLGNRIVIPYLVEYFDNSLHRRMVGDFKLDYYQWKDGQLTFKTIDLLACMKKSEIEGTIYGVGSSYYTKDKELIVKLENYEGKGLYFNLDKEIFSPLSSEWKVVNTYSTVIDNLAGGHTFTPYLEGVTSLTPEGRSQLANSSLAKDNPAAYALLQEEGTKLTFLTKPGEKPSLDALSPLLPSGKDLYAGTKLEDFQSKDGKAHVVQNKEEFERYYKHKQ